MGDIFYFDWEVRLMEWLQSFENPVVTTIATFFSMFGEELFLIAIVGFLYWCWDKEKAKPISLTLLFSLSICVQIKGLIIRRRPYMDNATVKCIRPAHKDGDIMSVSVQGYSCPSAHSALSVTTFGSIAYWFRKRLFLIIAFVVPICVGFSRIYFGVHYPTDVIGGWLVGVLSVLLISWLYNKLTDKKWIFLLITAITLTGIFYCRDSEYFTLLGLTLGFNLGYMFEQKFVQFNNTRSILKSVSRILGGVVLFFVLSFVLKLPFSAEFLSEASMLSFAVRTVRYLIIAFVIIGIYPKVFDKCKFI